MQVLALSAMSFGITKNGFLAAVIALSCVLAAELLSIVFLVVKMLRARRNRAEEEARQEEHRDYAFALLLLSILPASAGTILSVLAIAAAVAAIALVIMICVFRANGYDYPSDEWVREERARREEEERLNEIEAEEARRRAEEEQVFAAYDDPIGVFDEEQKQEEYTETEDTGEDVEEHASGMEPVGESGVTGNDAPYKTVERVEITRTIVREVPAQNPSSGDEELKEKLSQLIDLSIAEKTGKNADDESVDAFAESDFAEDDEDEDENDNDTEDLAEEEDADFDDDGEDGDHFTGNERIIGFDETTGCYIVAHYRKSFTAKLIQARPNIKHYYSELKNALLAYKGTKSRVSWTGDSFHNGRTQIAKINVKTRILEIYFALDPQTLDGTVYRGRDVSRKKKYEDTPFQYKIRTPRKFAWAMELVQRTCEEHGLAPIDIENVNYEEEYPFDTTENLVSRGLIKEYIRQEKPATSFEFSEDHRPALPEEDESVIPASANFTWEIDNERPTAEPEEVTEEPEEEPTEAEPAEPTAEEPAGESVIRETVHITETHYTERYYNDREPEYVTYEEHEIDGETSDEAQEAPATDETDGQEYESSDAFFAEESDAEQPAEDAEEEPADENGEEADADKFDNTDPFADDRDDAEEETDNADGYEAFGEAEEPEESEEAEEPEESADGEESTPAWEYADSWTVETDENADSDEEESDGEEEPYTEESYAEESYAEQEPAEEAEPEEEEAPRQSYPEPTKRPADPTVALVDVCTMAEYFPDGATVTLEALKQMGLVLPGAQTLSIWASGPISKALTVEAHKFTLDAIRVIDEAGGDLMMVR